VPLYTLGTAARIERIRLLYLRGGAADGPGHATGQMTHAAAERAGPATLSLVPPRPQVETDYAAEHQCGFWAAVAGGA
jgi:hypothetical protein